MDLRNWSNWASSVIADIYIKRFLKVGDASWKIVWQPGSWHTDIAAKARMRGSWAVRMVPKNVPKLVPEQPMRSASISLRLLSQSRSGLPAAIQFSTEKYTPIRGASY